MDYLQIAVIFLVVQSNSMSKSISILFVVLALSCVGVCQKSVTVTCETTSSSTCNTGYLYRLTGTSLNETICVPQGSTCNLALNSTYNVNNCTYDYLSTPCSTGICFYAANAQVALLGGSCSTEYNQTITCGSCVGVTCSSNICQTLTKTGLNPVVSCVDACANPSSVNMNIKACAGGYDALGTGNACCMTFKDSAGAVCSTQNSILTGSSKIKAYVKGTSGFEFYSVSVILSMIMLCLAMML